MRNNAITANECRIILHGVETLRVVLVTQSLAGPLQCPMFFDNIAVGVSDRFGEGLEQVLESAGGQKSTQVRTLRAANPLRMVAFDSFP